jgi:hypothetical protein
MNTIAKLRDELFEVFSNLKSGQIEPKIACEMNNSAGKIINTAKVQLDYHALRKEIPYLPFLESNAAKGKKS